MLQVCCNFLAPTRDAINLLNGILEVRRSKVTVMRKPELLMSRRFSSIQNLATHGEHLMRLISKTNSSCITAAVTSKQPVIRERYFQHCNI